MANLAHSCHIFTSPLTFANADFLPLLASTHTPTPVTMKCKYGKYKYSSKYRNTFVFNKSSIAKSAFTSTDTYICMCVHINIWGDGLFALQMNSPWNSLQYQVFHFSTASPTNILHSFLMYCCSGIHLFWTVRYPVFTKIKGEQNAFLWRLLLNFFNVPGVWACILHA